MAKVKVEVTALRSNEKSLQDQISQLEALGTRLQSLITRIEDSWEGEASTAYIRMMRRYAEQAAKMSTVLQAYKSYVKNAADTFESMDKKAASRINGSF